METKKEVLDRLWFKIKNMQKWGLQYEWLEERENGEYVKCEDVLKIIDGIQKGELMDSSRIIDFMLEHKPRIFWETDKKTYVKLRKLKDDAGMYLWSPNTRCENMPGLFLGHEIILNNRNEEIEYLDLVYRLRDGTYIKYPFHF